MKFQKAVSVIRKVTEYEDKMAALRDRRRVAEERIENHEIVLEQVDESFADGLAQAERKRERLAQAVADAEARLQLLRTDLAEAVDERSRVERARRPNGRGRRRSW